MNRHSVHRQRIGPAVRRMRRSKGLTLDELAGEADVSPSHLSRLERSQTLPSFPVLAKIADALGVDVNEFVRLEHDVTQLDQEISRYAGYLALDDDVHGELLDLSIEARHGLVERVTEISNMALTPADVQEQAVRAVALGRDDAPFSAAGTMIERAGIDAVSLSHALLLFDLLEGTRTALIAGPSLLPILPGHDLVGAYRWAFPRAPIDPVVAQWWRRTAADTESRGVEGRSFRGIVAEAVLESPLGPLIARSILSAADLLPSVELALTRRPLGPVNVLTVAGGYGLLEQLTTRRGHHDASHVAIWLAGTSRVGPCQAAVDRLWGALPVEERDSGTVRARLEEVAAQSG